MTQDQTQTLEWALRYHAAGWPIFPCRNKEPISEALAAWDYSWTNVRDDDGINEKTIRWWWEHFPDAQIAVACGVKSGITVIDIDWVKNPVTKQPLYDQGEKPCDLVTRWCTSITSVTGSGGRHVFCNYADVPNSTKTIHPQVDIRSQGGYVILPPSFHESGNKYEWEKLFPWHEENLKSFADFPQELRQPKANSTTEEGIARDEKWQAIVKGVSHGSRNTSAAALAGKLLRELDGHAAWELLALWNTHRNTPPLPEEELLKTYLSILKRDYARRPRRH